MLEESLVGKNNSSLFTDDSFCFTVPPEAPIFSPTREEFKDPILYINKIRPLAEICGICKIKPPPEWQPPFAVDVDNFRFTPRIQRVNELDAKTRIKLNFLDQIAKFWELQGSSLKIPTVEKKTLDLYTLNKCVQKEGGAQAITKEKKWSKIATALGYPLVKGIGAQMKGHYERILYPFVVFQEEKLKSGNEAQTKKLKVEPELKIEGRYKCHDIPSRQAVKLQACHNDRRAKRYSQRNLNGSAASTMNERDPRTSANTKNSERIKVEEKMKRGRLRGKKAHEDDPLAKYICSTCGKGDQEELMLLCDGCDDSIHTFCLSPPLTVIPKGDWRCPKCVAEEVSKPVEAFGFEQASRQYSLQEFSEMADQFKSDYFRMPVHHVPTALVEKEFWRIVSTIDDETTVEYGADLHSVEHGSGFPTEQTMKSLDVSHMTTEALKSYAKSPWNLNNLPVAEGSVLRYINADISGMKIPWMYVGMCFSTFCWHNEDHWSYSINYLHWGEPKTWYGVPGCKAELFEKRMKELAPELFETQPDLLHQLVTIMNPNDLMEADVPVFRTDQNVGEFVVTFPRAYHAGFNQGYNFAEAVNFATADWLKIGRECVLHYSTLHRYCVFSHDELVCKMANRYKVVDARVTAATFQDMLSMFETENKLRTSLQEWGVEDSEREPFELLPDDERQCCYCKTTCFLSAVTCQCSNDKLVCITHYTELCKCLPKFHKLRYRYSLDEILLLMNNLKEKAEEFDSWLTSVKDALVAAGDDRLTYKTMNELLTVAKERKYQSTELLQDLVKSLKEAEQCSTVAEQLEFEPTRGKKKLTELELSLKLSYDELNLFYLHVKDLHCKIPEEDNIETLLNNARSFKHSANKVLEEFTATSLEITALLEKADTMDLYLEEVVPLEARLHQVKWLEEVKQLREEPEKLTTDRLRSLIKDGTTLVPNFFLEAGIAELQQTLNDIERWEEQAKAFSLTKNHQTMVQLEVLLNEASKIKAFLPSRHKLNDTLRRAKEWTRQAELTMGAKILPFVDIFEELIMKGKTISIQLDILETIEAQVNTARMWKEKVSLSFLRKNSPYTLLEILSPRSEVGVKAYKLRKRSSNKIEPKIHDVKLSGRTESVAIVTAFKKAEKLEYKLMVSLRSQNIGKRQFVEEARYCLCRKAASGFMVECSLCQERFHGSCIPMGKISSKQKAETIDTKFLCPVCIRSRRPRLNDLLILFSPLQNMSVRLPEGEALHCLLERAMKWQARAKKLLNSDEMLLASAKLSQQAMEASMARRKTDNIYGSDLKKASITQELLHPARLAAKGDEPCRLLGEPSTSSEQQVQNVVPYNSEHAYSAVSKRVTPVKKHMRKSPLVPRVLEEPVFRLSPSTYSTLQDMMVRGDMIEVTLDETHQMWKILQAFKPPQPSPATIEEETIHHIETVIGVKLPPKVTPTATSTSTSMVTAPTINKGKRRANKVETGSKKRMKFQCRRKGKKANCDLGKADSSLTAEGNDEDNDCAADPCRHPTGREVDWVQCDGGCDLWFHLYCLGITKEDIDIEEDYVCVHCLSRQCAAQSH